MGEVNYGAGNSNIQIRLDPDILQDLIVGDGSAAGDDKNSSLRELQVYRLFKHLVSDLNGKLKGRRERFKLVDEGDGLIFEYDS
ncbi:MAG: hypothetical protein HRU15_10005 [Planctomycetes bacterium]|nr:hypothetical protein [Planctomycetota bacterium]